MFRGTPTEGGKDSPKGIVQTLRRMTPHSLTAYAKVYHSHHKTFWEEQVTGKVGSGVKREVRRSKNVVRR